MNLLVDIGNTRLKWACDYQGDLSLQTAVAHQQADWQTQLLTAWEKLASPQKLLISSVATAHILQAVINLATQLWDAIEIVIPKSTASGFGVKNSYAQPEKLGVDRWLCLLAARHFYPKTAVWIVDCGTAITVDFLSADGVHGGGLICPGLTLMKKSLLNNTAELSFSQRHYALRLANQTEAAIFSGTLYAAVGLIESAIKTQDSYTKILLTGGDAELIHAHLAYPVSIDPDLVLKGLSVVSGFQQAR